MPGLPVRWRGIILDALWRGIKNVQPSLKANAVLTSKGSSVMAGCQRAKKEIR